MPTPTHIGKYRIEAELGRGGYATVYQAYDLAPTAEAMLDDIVAQGGNAIEIERWWNGGWDAHVRDLPFNNFTLALGRGYFVRASSASAWTRTGLPPVAPLPLKR